MLLHDFGKLDLIFLQFKFSNDLENIACNSLKKYKKKTSERTHSEIV